MGNCNLTRRFSPDADLQAIALTLKDSRVDRNNYKYRGKTGIGSRSRSLPKRLADKGRRIICCRMAFATLKAQCEARTKS